MEFARGAEHGGWQAAFPHFPAEMLRRGAILYIDVSWAESLRKNRRRFNPERPDSILEHALPDEKMEQLYRDSDWVAFTANDPQFVTVNGVPVPYVVFENEDDVTTERGAALRPAAGGDAGAVVGSASRRIGACPRLDAHVLSN